MENEIYYKIHKTHFKTKLEKSSVTVLTEIGKIVAYIRKIKYINLFLYLLPLEMLEEHIDFKFCFFW